MLYISFKMEHHRSTLRIRGSASNVFGFLSLGESTVWADIVQSQWTMNAVGVGGAL